MSRLDQIRLPLEPPASQQDPIGTEFRPLLPNVARKPFLKWAGGKGRLLERILPYVPSAIENYHEPFLGGGAMFFAVRGRVRNRSILTDLNEELINAWRAVQCHPGELSAALGEFAKHDSRDFYLHVRTLQLTNAVERAARFIYLNQTSWNGLWRVNKWGQFNVPWGNRPFRGLSDDFLTQLHSVLSDVSVQAGDFRDALKQPQPGDFVYLDPPYLPISDTSKFYLYTEQRFREPDLRQLAALCHDLSDRGVAWVLSNRDTPLVRELFGSATIVALTVQRSVAAQNARDVEARQSPEVIIIGSSSQ